MMMRAQCWIKLAGKQNTIEHLLRKDWSLTLNYHCKGSSCISCSYLNLIQFPNLQFCFMESVHRNRINCFCSWLKPSKTILCFMWWARTELYVLCSFQMLCSFETFWLIVNCFVSWIGSAGLTCSQLSQQSRRRSRGAEEVGLLLEKLNWNF